MVGPQTGAPARLRRELYQKRFREHGIDDLAVDRERLHRGRRPGRHDPLLDADPQPTAIVYSNDLMAIAGMGTAFARGLRMPEDISIVGWDDITVSQYLHPALSTVTQHPFDDGRMAATLLLEAIEGREFVEPVWMPNPRFVPRESSGTAPA